MDLDLTQCENSALKEVIDWLLPEFCGKTMVVVEFYLILEVRCYIDWPNNRSATEASGFFVSFNP